MDNALRYSEDGQTIIGCDRSYSDEIIIPEGVINIADCAFINCSISRIVLPLSLKKIGRWAFADCSNLLEVLLNDGLGEIASSAFSGCNSLVKIKMPSCLGRLGSNDYIEGSIFEGCISLESIEIPKGVTEIPREAFAGCVNLLSIRLPETIRYIDIDAFKDCVSLHKVIISDIARWCYVIRNSNPLDYAHHLYIDDETEIVDLEIPEKIGSISAHSFENCTGIKKVCFPDGYVDVGKDAFKGCVGLKELTLKSYNVGEILSAFEGCYNIEVINIKCFNPSICIGLKGFKKLKAVYSIDDNGKQTQVDVNGIIRAKAQEMKFMSMYYHTINMNLTMVQGKYPDKTSFKTPIEKDGMLLENLYSSKQEASILLKQDWINISGMGLVLGWNDYRALDFDYFISPINILEEGDRKYDIEDYNIGDYRRECLSLLGLPEDYQWVVWSGSKKGFHIIIRVKEFGENESAPISYSFVPNNYPSKRIELRWKGHLVLPPSIHYSGEIYSFFNNQIPTTAPQYVELGTIDDLLDKYCGKTIIQSYTLNYRRFDLIEREKSNTTNSEGIACFSSWFDKDKDVIHWLKECATPQSYNSLAIKYLLGDGVPSDKKTAYNYFKKANNWQAFFNLASLISIGYFDGTQQELNDYLEQAALKGLLDRANIIRRQAAKYFHHNTYLFFDSETTGIPNDYNAPSSDTDNWPRLVQLAWILEDETGTKIQSRNYIVRPEGFKIPEEAAKIHGITTERAFEEGVYLGTVIDDFIEDLEVATYIIGHNVDFDKKIVGAEMIRLGMEDIMDSKKSYCTMQSSIDFCRIPGKYGYKYPKLQELYKKLFGSEFDNAHNAMSDIEATEQCFWELRKRKLI